MLGGSLMFLCQPKRMQRCTEHPVGRNTASPAVQQTQTHTAPSKGFSSKAAQSFNEPIEGELGNAPHTCRLCDGYILHTSRLGGACRADILWVPGEGKLSPRSIATWRRYTPPKEHCFAGRVYESTLPGEQCSLGRVHLFRCLVHSPESPCVLPLTKSRASQSQDTELVLLFLML